MLFNSFVFVVFFIALYAIYAATFNHRKFQNFLVASPILDELQTDPIWQRYYEEVRGDIRSKFEGSRVKLHLDPYAVPASMLQNADHVTTEGARKYTLRVLELIRESER